MNKFFLMLAASGLIAAAPAYYAFQAQADDGAGAGAGVSASTNSTSVDAGANASVSTTDSSSNPDRTAPDAQGATRSPGSAPGESDVDASTSTDTVGE